MYYAINAQGSQSLPSLVSLLALSLFWARAFFGTGLASGRRNTVQ